MAAVLSLNYYVWPCAFDSVTATTTTAETAAAVAAARKGNAKIELAMIFFCTTHTIFNGGK